MANTYLSKTLSTPTSAYKYTFSALVKLSEDYTSMTLIGGGSSAPDTFVINSSGKLTYYANDGSEANIATEALLTDIGSWYHIVLGVDTSQAVSTNRVAIYVNGVEQTALSSTTAPSENYTNKINAAQLHRIGYNPSGGAEYWSGYMTQVILVDGTKLAASDFGSFSATNGVWTPNTSPSVTYGNNGFNLDFADAADMGNDVSGNANDFSVSGTLTKAEDSPSSNYCTLNNLGLAAKNFTIIEGNTYSGGADNNWRSVFGTLGSGTGKYYYEVKCISSSDYERFGACTVTQANKCTANTGRYDDSTYGSEGYGYTSDGEKSNNGGTSAGYGDTWGAGDILSCALDLDNNFIYFGKAGVWQNSGVPTSGASGTGAAYTIASGIYIPAFASYGAAANLAFNFGNGYFRTTPISSAGTNASGEGIFEYDVPTGYTALSTKGFNL